MTTPFRLRSVLCRIALAVSFTAAVHAGPPFITDDPEPVELHHWEIYLASLQNHDSGGWSGTVPTLEMNYGILPDVHLHLQPQAAYEKPTDGKGHYGFGDTEIGAKWRFIHTEEYGHELMIGIFPLVELPTGSSARGLGNGKAQVFLPIWLQKAFGEQWTAYGGGGWWFNPGAGNRDWWYAGAVLQRKITGTFAVGAEVQFRGAATVDDRNSWALNGGFIWDLSEKYHLLLSAGHTVSGRSQFQGYAALQITWGPKDGDSAAKK